jgi:hypothetical protein
MNIPTREEKMEQAKASLSSGPLVSTSFQCSWNAAAAAIVDQLFWSSFETGVCVRRYVFA